MDGVEAIYCPTWKIMGTFEGIQLTIFVLLTSFPQQTSSYPFLVPALNIVSFFCQQLSEIFFRFILR